ncbi:unnamed protein product, partial [Phaeothamnion confervicola]
GTSRPPSRDPLTRSPRMADAKVEEAKGACLRVIEFLERGGLGVQSVSRLIALIDQQSYSVQLGLAMPYLNHDELLSLMQSAWEAMATLRLATRKAAYRKVRNLEADKNTEEEVLRRWLGERDKADREYALAAVALARAQQAVRMCQEGAA